MYLPDVKAAFIRPAENLKYALMVFYYCLGIVPYGSTKVQRGVRPRARPTQSREHSMVHLPRGQFFKAVKTETVYIISYHWRFSGWNAAPCLSACCFSSCSRLANTLLSTKG